MDIFDISDTSDLPECILMELNKVTKGKMRRSNIVDLIKTYKGSISVDHIQVGYFRKHREHIPRKRLLCDIHKIIKSQVGVKSVKGKKGFYKYG